MHSKKKQLKHTQIHYTRCYTNCNKKATLRSDIPVVYHET